jgi:chromosome segregation ATPase
MNTRLQTELDGARDRVALRDRDLLSVQTALRSLEDERRKLGDEHTSDRFSLELEIDRVKRDLERYEEELDRAREEAESREGVLRQREAELAEMVGSSRDG